MDKNEAAKVFVDEIHEVCRKHGISFFYGNDDQYHLQAIGDKYRTYDGTPMRDYSAEFLDMDAVKNTTGQETVATPRDGGVNEAREQVAQLNNAWATYRWCGPGQNDRGASFGSFKAGWIAAAETRGPAEGAGNG